jgi:Dynein heavy chain, N-terminal region 2
VQVVCEPALADCHWAEIGKLLGLEAPQDTPPTLQRLLTHGAASKLAPLAAIARAASCDAAAAAALDAMRLEWSEAKLEVRCLEGGTNAHLGRRSGSGSSGGACARRLANTHELRELAARHIQVTAGDAFRAVSTGASDRTASDAWRQTLERLETLLATWSACQAALDALAPALGPTRGTGTEHGARSLARKLPGSREGFAQAQNLLAGLLEDALQHEGSALDFAADETGAEVCSALACLHARAHDAHRHVRAPLALLVYTAVQLSMLQHGACQSESCTDPGSATYIKTNGSRAGPA